MLGFVIEAREHFERIDDITLVFVSFDLVFLSFLDIEQTSVDHELLAADSFVKSCVVKFNDCIFEIHVLLSVVFKELKVG